MLHRKRRFADDRLKAHPHSQALSGSDNRYLRSQKIGGEAIGAQAIGTKAIGTLAIGAIAIGALAVGALTIGWLSIGRARIRRVEIGDLVVRRLRITHELELPEKPKSDS
ncbi:MAG: hypothetical protein ABW106_12300 [Steroidobacteraceae bacterium]